MQIISAFKTAWLITALSQVNLEPTASVSEIIKRDLENNDVFVYMKVAQMIIWILQQEVLSVHQ